jgi:tRNA(Leu) C34 or U34 (ribose-2'-O)-methylase TrmL
MSFYFDVRILFQTIKVVLFGQESRDLPAEELTAESGQELGSAA